MSTSCGDDQMPSSLQYTTNSRRLSNTRVWLSLKFPHLSAIILILFTVVVYTEIVFVQTIAGLPFVYDSFCQNKTLQSTSARNNTLVTSFQAIIVFLAFPVAGWLADDKYGGRYKVINASIWLIWVGLLLMVPSLLIYAPKDCHQQDQILSPIGITLFYVSLVIFSLGAAGFLPNILPFVIDQLTDASTSWVSSYVRWYAWTQFCGTLLGYIPLIFYYGTVDTPPSFAVVMVVIFGLHCIVVIANIFCKSLFSQSQSYDNPYRTVFGVVNFARKHKVPIRRSAMTYCESGLPGRLDLAKAKYGGPYTHESVENVKTFFRILVVFLGLGGYYFTLSGPDYKLPYFLSLPANSLNSSSGYIAVAHWVLVFNDPIIPILTIPIVELVVHWWWPKFEYYLHKPFIWITIGFIALVVCNGYLMIVAGLTGQNTHCSFFIYADKLTNIESILLVVIPNMLYAISDVFVFTSTLYFIVCQAPSSMRGMLLGLFLLGSNVLESVGNLASLLFTMLNIKFPQNCEIWYWGALFTISCASFLIFLIIVKKYRKRERQEIVNYRGMIENAIEQDIQRQQQQKVTISSSLSESYNYFDL